MQVPTLSRARRGRGCSGVCQSYLTLPPTVVEGAQHVRSSTARVEREILKLPHTHTSELHRSVNEADSTLNTPHCSLSLHIQ